MEGSYYIKGGAGTGATSTCDKDDEMSKHDTGAVDGKTVTVIPEKAGSQPLYQQNSLTLSDKNEATLSVLLEGKEFRSDNREGDQGEDQTPPPVPPRRIVAPPVPPRRKAQVSEDQTKILTSISRKIVSLDTKKDETDAGDSVAAILDIMNDLILFQGPQINASRLQLLYFNMRLIVELLFYVYDNKSHQTKKTVFKAINQIYDKMVSMITDKVKGCTNIGKKQVIEVIEVIEEAGINFEEEAKKMLKKPELLECSCAFLLNKILSYSDTRYNDENIEFYNKKLKREFSCYLMDIFVSGMEWITLIVMDKDSQKIIKKIADPKLKSTMEFFVENHGKLTQFIRTINYISKEMKFIIPSSNSVLLSAIRSELDKQYGNLTTEYSRVENNQQTVGNLIKNSPVSISTLENFLSELDSSADTHARYQLNWWLTRLKDGALVYKETFLIRPANSSEKILRNFITANFTAQQLENAYFYVNTALKGVCPGLESDILVGSSDCTGNDWDQFHFSCPEIVTSFVSCHSNNEFVGAGNPLERESSEDKKIGGFVKKPVENANDQENVLYENLKSIEKTEDWNTLLSEAISKGDVNYYVLDKFHQALCKEVVGDDSVFKTDDFKCKVLAIINTYLQPMQEGCAVYDGLFDQRRHFIKTDSARASKKQKMTAYMINKITVKQLRMLSYYITTAMDIKVTNKSGAEVSVRCILKKSDNESGLSVVRLSLVIAESVKYLLAQTEGVADAQSDQLLSVYV